MTWYAVIEDATGALFSGTDQQSALASPMPARFVVKELPMAPQPGDRWDAATRTFIARKADVEMFIEQLEKRSVLTLLQKDAIRASWPSFEQRVATGV